MKKLMSLALLATLASYGASGATSSNMDPQRFQELALSAERGLVSIESKIGTELSFSYDEDENFTAEVVPMKRDEYSVILKIDGTKIYKYIEDRDLLTGLVRKSVDVDDVSAEKLSEALKLPGVSLSGSIFTLNGTVNNSFDIGENASFTSKMSFSVRVDLSAFHCSETSASGQFDVKLTQNGVVTSVPDSQTSSTTKCEAALSSAKLKALDLSAIEVCEESTTEEDEWNCETRNMEFLTDDIIL
jgi:hypothetical protein